MMNRSMPDVPIRPIGRDDRHLWEPLWTGYLDFYERTVGPAVSELTWDRLSRTAEILGLLAVDQHGAAVGLVHFFYHPSASHIGGYCYLQDLFVVPAARGRRVGRRLIAAVAAAAKAKGAEILYWQTEEFNGPARRLYERVAKRSPFIRYQMELTDQPSVD